MMRIIIAISFLISFSQVTFAGENCTCRYKEADVAEGQTICMKTPNGSQMATCARVLNNTSWKFSGQPCPTAHLQKNQNSTSFDLEEAKNLLLKKG